MDDVLYKWLGEMKPTAILIGGKRFSLVRRCRTDSLEDTIGRIKPRDFLKVLIVGQHDGVDPKKMS